MKFNLTAITIFISLISLKAQDYQNQKYDRQRLNIDILTLGCPNIDTSDKLIRIGNIFDFNDDTLQVIGVDTFFQGETTIKFEQYTNSTQICNKEGKFTAFTNGYLLYDRYGNYEELTMLDEPLVGYRGHLGYNRSLMLPFVGRDSTYILLTPTDHIEDPNYEVLNPTSIAGIVFREESNGRLKILEYIPEIIKGNFCFYGALSAVRHANGRDWWIVAPQRLDNKVHTFLFGPNGFSNKSTQVTKYVTGDVSYNPEFSPDGRWYTRTDVKILSQWHYVNTIQLYRFNRCSGEFEDQIQFEMDYEDTSNVIQVIFEKNSKYFYITHVLNIYQGDIDAADIKGSLIKVGQSRPLKWDEHMIIGAGFLAPDDKIHIFNGWPNFYSSIINNPSERGLACDFQYEYRTFPACTSIAFGNMPNFNLGPLDGSPCDTLGLDNSLAIEKDTKKHIEYNIFPNPSNSLIHTDYNFERNDLKMKLLDFKGKVIMNANAISLETGIDISDIAPGVYFVIIEGMPVKKMIKI